MDGRSTGSKRSNEDSHSSDRQQRQRREKYTPVACNECKKRKVKCSGGTTCQRCDSMDLTCVYMQNGSIISNYDSNSGLPDKVKDLEARFGSVQSQLDQIFGLISNMQAQPPNYVEQPVTTSVETLDQARTLAIDSGSDTTPRRHQRPQFVGLASAAYTFNVGKSSLKSMGVQHDSSKEPESIANSPRSSPRLQSRVLQPVPDPLRQIGLDEALRLLAVYEDELDGIYPFLNIPKMENFIRQFYGQFQDPQPSSRTLGNKPPKIDARATEVLKMVFAEVLTLEGFGSSVQAEQLVESVEEARVRRLRTMRADIQDVKILMLQSIYYFHCDEELPAWRTIGFAVRLALEMGLHRTDSLFKRFPTPEERSWAVKVFWCIYVLDRRWSFGTGMPFALHQDDIDPDLPEPDDSSPYLQQMIAYGRINTKVWKAVNGPAATSPKTRKEESGYLDFQIQRWQQATPPELQLLHPKVDNGVQIQPRSLHRLRVLLHLRANQTRILISRHHLLTTNNINENRSAAQSVVDIAKDTIQVLEHLNRTTNIYHMQQVCFNYFLVSALATIFLAVCHAPNFFSQSCRAEFYLALGLVKGFSSKSLIAQRLWKTIRDLQHIGPKLGLTPSNAEPEVPIVNAALPTPLSSSIGDSTIIVEPGIEPHAWNSSKNTISTPLPQQENGWDWIPSYGASNIGSHMSFALTDLFEAAGGNTNQTEVGDMMTDGGPQSAFVGTQYLLENNEVVSKLLGDLISCEHPQYI